MEEKTCLKCSAQKPISEFSKNKSTKDGFERWCRKCKAEAGAELRARRKGNPVPETVTVTLDRPKATWKDQAIANLMAQKTRIENAIEVIQGME